MAVHTVRKEMSDGIVLVRDVSVTWKRSKMSPTTDPEGHDGGVVDDD